MTKIVALVPMKQNSVRVKNKNTRVINGKPLYYWILTTLQKCSYIGRIIVDTDTEYMKEHIENHFSDIEIKLRPSELIGSDIPMNDVINHNLSFINDGEVLLQTHVTNPLLKSKTIENAIECFNNNDCDSLFSAVSHYKRFYDKDAKPINHDMKVMQNTQDMAPVMEENSNIFMFTKDSFAKTNGRIGENPYIFEMGGIESSDIDNEEDWDLVKLIMENIK